jgi:radical SAM superfamily enzyme YgiQ (UPF0313 family)
MMKVLLIYPNIAKTLQIPMGLAYISSYLKENGIEVFLWDGTFDSVATLKGQVKAIEPDFICFSALSPDYAFVEDLARELRPLTSAQFVIGGYHASFLPLEISMLFDPVFIGEAEYSLLDYIQNPTDRRLIYGKLADINKLPWPDHEMFKKHFTKTLNWETFEHATSGVFLTARGCPFKCTYCSCESMSKFYEEKNTRFRDIDDIIREISATSHQYQMDTIWFTDETFTVSKKRILEFCAKYREAIGIPFSVETRPDTVNEEVLVALKEAGCTTIRMGIESGVDRIRNGLYGRNMSRKRILDAFHTAKKVGLKTASYNIIGAPTETIEDIRATIALNVECGVESGKMTLLSVFPGTRMWDYCIENGYEIREKYPENYYIDSNITHETLSVDQLIDLRGEFEEAL